MRKYEKRTVTMSRKKGDDFLRWLEKAKSLGLVEQADDGTWELTKAGELLWMLVIQSRLNLLLVFSIGFLLGIWFV